MFRLDCVVIVTALLCWSHAHISKSVDLNFASSGGHRLRPRSILANGTDTPANKSALPERIGQPTDQQEISDIFAGNLQHVSTSPQIGLGLPNEGSVGPGLMEGGGGVNNTLIRKDTILDQKIASHIPVSATNGTEIIGSKQETTKSDNNNSSRHSVIGDIESEPILDKLELGSNADNSTEDGKLSKIHARKGAENKKINARKGVDVNTTHARKGVVLDIDLTNKTSASSTASFPESISTVITSTPATETHYSMKNVTNLPAFGNMTDTLTKSVSDSNISVNYTQPSQVTLKHDTPPVLTNRTHEPVDDTSKVSNDGSAKADGGIISSIPLQKKTTRPKPLITTDKSADTPVFQGRTPSQHDYVIPIVVAILAVPMVLVLLVYLYKKGSESWERRHYRRMDFLIDGIYND